MSRFMLPDVLTWHSGHGQIAPNLVAPQFKHKAQVMEALRARVFTRAARLRVASVPQRNGVPWNAFGTAGANYYIAIHATSHVPRTWIGHSLGFAASCRFARG